MKRQEVICTDRKTLPPPQSGSRVADCTRCKALCCILLPFDTDQGFGFDKPAATPCPHLDANFRCSIHASLAEHGFPGCVQFDCHGAGQQVTAQLNLAENWYECEETQQEAYTLFTAARACVR